MTAHHIADVIFRSAVWRAMHGVSPIVALVIAGAAVLVAGIYLVRR